MRWRRPAACGCDRDARADRVGYPDLREALRQLGSGVGRANTAMRGPLFRTACAGVIRAPALEASAWVPGSARWSPLQQARSAPRGVSSQDASSTSSALHLTRALEPLSSQPACVGPERVHTSPSAYSSTVIAVTVGADSDLPLSRPLTVIPMVGASAAAEPWHRAWCSGGAGGLGSVRMGADNQFPTIQRESSSDSATRVSRSQRFIPSAETVARLRTPIWLGTGRS